ncbi:MAG: hypothetical protein ABSD62_13945 [Candidatus Limnocylindrales bacterium]|jgi:hypothetical protein
MTSVSIALIKGLSGNADVPPVAGDVVGRILSVSAGRESVTAAPRLITIPVRGAYAPEAENLPMCQVELPMGQYVVDAFLPSGDLVSADFMVDSNEPKQVSLFIEHSAHEWLSWQHLAGNVPAASEFRAGLRTLESAGAVPPSGWPAWVIAESTRPIGTGLTIDLLARAAGNRIPMAEYPERSHRAPNAGSYSDGPYSAYEFTSPSTVEGRR